MVVELSSLISDKQKPAPSFVNWRLHNIVRSGELELIAKSFAVALDSGKSPEKPPLATTAGSFPENKQTHVWVLKHKQTNNMLCNMSMC